MINLDAEFTDNLKKIREKSRELSKHLNEDTGLPDDLNSPCQHDAETVKHFADTAYELACDISSLGEQLMVGDEVEKIWEEKPENCYADIEEKRNDHGVYQRDF